MGMETVRFLKNERRRMMMKIWKRIGSLLLIAVLSMGMLAGCSGKQESGDRKEGGSEGGLEGEAPGGGQTEDSAEDGQDRGAGRFVETERTLPEGVDLLMATERGSDGSIYGFGCDGQHLSYYLMKTTDRGENWELTKVQELGALYISRSACGPDGSVAAFGYYSENADVGLKIIAPDGSVGEVPLSLPAYEGGADGKNQIVQAKYTTDGELLAVDLNDNLYRVDTQSGSMTQVNSAMAGQAGYVDTVGDKILLVTGEGVKELDASNGELGSTSELLKDTTNKQEMLGTDGNYFPVVYDQGASEGSVVYVNHQGLFYLEENGAVSEQLINGEQVSLGDESTMFSAVYTISQEEYLVFGADSLGVSRCYYYKYDASASAVPTRQLEIYALEDSAVLQQVISYYKKENPDVFVKKTIGMAEGSGMTAEDALRALNTELLAGDGPDLLVLDGMPVDSYREKGVLVDLKSYVEEAEGSDGLFTNITGSFAEEGRLCQVPLRFYFTVTEGGADALAAGKSLKDLAAYAVACQEKNPGKQILSNTTAKNLLETLFYGDSAGWRGEDGSIDKEKLSAFLTAAETLYKLDSHENVTENMGKARVGGSLYGTVNYAANGRFLGTSQVSFGTLTDAGDLQELCGIQAQIGGSAALFNPEGGNAFVPYVSLGMTGKGEENPSARQFVQTALSDGCQSVISDGFPINRKTYQDNFGRMKEYSIAMSGPDDEVTGYEVGPLGDASRQELTAMIESLNVPAMTDRVILELVLTEGESCLKGNQSVEQAVDAILQKVRLYLAE